MQSSARLQTLLRRLAVVMIVPFSASGPAPAHGGAAAPGLGDADRVLILAPHPDDEILGCGGIIQQAVAKRLPLRIVFLTNGDFNERSFAVYRKHPVIEPSAVLRMGRIRRDEALAAARILGVPSENLVFLGYPDFGTLQIFESHWGARPPFRSYLTERTSVPYAHALRPGAPHKGESILQDLGGLLREFNPTRVFVSHPADHHPDHRALFLFARVALWEAGSGAEVFPYLVHHHGWPIPQGYHPELQLEPPADLSEVKEWRRFDLTAEGRGRKFRALKAHETQFEYSAPALSAFVRTTELFGAIPALAAAAQPEPGGDTATLTTNVPGHLLESERARFIAVALTGIRRESDAVEFTLEVNHWHPGGVVSLFVFPYGGSREFASMPKLHLRLTAESEEVFDQDRKLPGESVPVKREGNGRRVRFPRAMLAGGDRLLVSARTRIEFVPLDWTPWRVIELSR